MTSVRQGSVRPLRQAALRTDARILASRGHPLTAIARTLGVHPATVSRWLT